MSERHADDHGHEHGHGHDHHHGGHGHAHDRGVKGALRYLRHGRRMWQTSINRAVVDLVAPQAHERAVDIGAGMGPTTVIAAQRDVDVVAVDPTPFMRAVLRLRRLGQRKRRHITVADGAAEAIPTDAGSVDAVWSVNTMHHWTDPAAAAVEIHRVLRPGGRVILVDEDFDDPRHEHHGDFADRHGGDHDEHGMHMVNVEKMAAHFRDAGFADIDPHHEDLGGQPCRILTARKPDL